jgi:hypothetical protein
MSHLGQRSPAKPACHTACRRIGASRPAAGMLSAGGRGMFSAGVRGMLGLLVACGTLPAPAEAQRPVAPASSATPLWISDTPLDDGRRLLIVIDPATRHAAVYHVDPVTGGMVLKSTRDISWDLRLDDFNAQEPKPATLRKMLEPAGRP